jgi:hypothetical protein
VVSFRRFFNYNVAYSLLRGAFVLPTQACVRGGCEYLIKKNVIFMSSPAAAPSTIIIAFPAFSLPQRALRFIHRATQRSTPFVEPHRRERARGA